MGKYAIIAVNAINLGLLAQELRSYVHSSRPAACIRKACQLRGAMDSPKYRNSGALQKIRAPITWCCASFTSHPVNAKGATLGKEAKP